MNTAFSLLPVYTANILGIILIIILLMGNSWRLKRFNLENKALLVMIFATLTACITDPLVYTFDGHSGALAAFVVYFGNSWLYVCNMITTFAWFIFLSLHLNGKINKLNTIVMGALSAAGLIMIVVNLWCPMIFRVDSSNVYSRGPFYYVFMAIALIYIANSIWIYRCSIKRGGMFKFFPIWLFILPIIAGVLVQTCIYGLSIIWASVAIAISSIFLSLQNETIFRDDLTGLYNRSCFDYMKERYKNRMPKELTGIMLDINRFKAINDNFGHAAGDEALQITADILRRTVGDLGMVIRYAGDEFVILLNTQETQKVHEIMDSIRGNITEFNNRGEKEYQLSLSMGYEKMKGNMASINDFMNEIDKKMYEDKSRFYAMNPDLDRRLANDQLTGLYTRFTFYNYATAMLQQHPDDRFDIIISDIENFKVINEKYGEAAGDELLRYVGKNLAKMNSADCIFARYSGDQFVGFMRMTRTVSEEDMAMFTSYMDALYQNAPIDHFSVKFGMYCDVDHDLPVSIMCDRALMAVRTIKYQYNQTLAFYDQRMKQKFEKEQRILDGMRNAIDNEEFKIYYQPKHDIRSGAIVGAEALVRWEHPEYGFMSPAEFIPLFESNGFISAMDEYAWNRTCQFVADMRDKEITVPPISINASRKDLLDEKFLKSLQKPLDMYRLTTDHFHLEVTESAYMANPAAIIPVVDQVRNMGIQVELDDFGSGYSSLNLLSRLPMDIIKIDQEFIREIENQMDITESIIMLAHRLGYRTVAEGVETEKQLDILKGMNCDYVQGYYYAKPMPEDDFENYLLCCRI